MATNIRTRPDYPFAEANLEATILEVDAFVADPPLAGAERAEVLEFVRLTRQYAFLERLIQGDIRFELPIHMELFATDADESAGGQAERMARAERELLGLGIEPAEELLDALDDRGIKVFRRTRGPEPCEALTGSFHYAGDSGPAVLVGATEACPEAVFILAHEYGHLVMDVNPYASRFCRWHRLDLANRAASTAEQRADRFARALLLPEEVMRSSVRELMLDSATDAAIARTAEIFDVPAALVWRRLDDLEMPGPEAPPRPRAVRRRHRVDEVRPTDLPERFVNLALAAFASRYLEKPELGRFLRVPPDRLESFLEWSRIPRALKRDDLVAEEEEGGEIAS